MQAGKNNNLAYNQDLQPVAIRLRSNATKAEACLWKYVLRAGQMKGYTFRRQRPVLEYVADFMCQPLKLIVEVDGAVHKEEEVAAKDLVRQERLERAGFTVLRFSNAMVLYQIEDVRKVLEQWIEDAAGEKSH
jgi:very-short-patch-repair endonuclease